MITPAYTLKTPKNASSCVVFNSPHSGAEYPADFLAMTRLDTRAIRSSEDAYVDELFGDAPLYGAPLLAARFPRAYVDLNRSVDEMDPALVRGVRLMRNNPRVAAGLGVIPRVVGGHKVIRSGKMSAREAQQRITEAYLPYHARLSTMLKETRQRFGIAVLVDCHSMPHAALDTMHEERADIIIGDLHGGACNGWISDMIADIFASEGFSVGRNSPFAGGYITRHYGCPADNIHAIQIEVDRAIYMDEVNVVRHADFADIQRVFSRITGQLAGIGCANAAIAAE